MFHCIPCVYRPHTASVELHSGNWKKYLTCEIVNHYMSVRNKKCFSDVRLSVNTCRYSLL